MELPHLQKMYQQLKDKGLEILGINFQAGDSEETIKKYIADNGFTFKMVRGGGPTQYTIGKTYGVMAYPTNYLVDTSGKIVWRSVGFDEEGLREALARLGLK